MGGGKKVDDTVPTTKSDLGQFGSTTTGHWGSRFDASDFQKEFTTNSQDAILKAQNAYNNREVAQEAIDNMNRQYQTDFQNNLLAPALNKGWLRGSTAQDVATVANQDYQNRRYDLVDQELNRQQQNLANNLANYMTMYDIAKGVTGLSNALNSQISNFQLEAQRANQQSADARYAANMQLIGDALGAMGSAAGGGKKNGK